MLRTFKITLRFIVLLWAIPQMLLGYIDPNTGGLIFQVLAIILAASSAIILFFSRQIRVGVARVTRFVRERYPH